MKNLLFYIFAICLLSCQAMTLGSKGDWQKIGQEQFFEHEWNKNVLEEAQNSVNDQSNLEDFQFKEVILCRIHNYITPNIIQVKDIQFQFHDGMKLKMLLTYENPEGIQRHFQIELFSQPWNKIVQVTSVNEISTLQPFKMKNFQSGPGIQINDGSSLLDKILNPFSKFVNVTEPQWEKQSFIKDEQSLRVAQEAVNDKYEPKKEGFKFDRVISVRQNVEAFNYILSYTNKDVVQLYEILVAKDSETDKFNPLICYFIKELNTKQIKSLREEESNKLGGWSLVGTDKFEQQNSNILPLVLQSIDTQYDPEVEGFQFDNIILVQQQVVAGMNYKLTIEYSNGNGQIQIYDVVVYDIPWQNSVTVTSCNQVGQYNIKPTIEEAKQFVAKKDIQEFGSWETQNSTQFQSQNNLITYTANQAIQRKYNPSASNCTFGQVVQIKDQVVSGLNYDITIEYFCKGYPYQQFYDVVIYECPWTNSTDVISCNQQEVSTIDGMLSAFPSQAGEPLSGGWNSINPNSFASQNSDVLSVTQQAVNQQYNPEENGYYYSGVQSVSSQVVAGVNYNIVLIYSNDDGEKQYYEVTVYDIPWQQKIEVTGCNMISEPTLRQRYGWTLQKQAPESVLSLAQRSIQQNFQDSNFQQLVLVKQQGIQNYELLLQYEKAKYIVMSTFKQIVIDPYFIIQDLKLRNIQQQIVSS